MTGITYPPEMLPQQEDGDGEVYVVPRWRPISDAPKDGSSVLLAYIREYHDYPAEVCWATRGHWSEKWKNWNDGLEPSGLAGPTHFLPFSSILMPQSGEFK